MNLYDPSLSLPSPVDSYVPVVSWSAKYREQMDAEITAPIADKYDAPQSRRYQIREFVVGEMHRALRSLAPMYHSLPIAGRININQLTEPTEAEKRTALARLRADTEMMRLAKKIAECRGYLRHLDALDVRDSISSRPAVPVGNSSPGLATSSNSRGATTFFPAGLR